MDNRYQLKFEHYRPERGGALNICARFHRGRMRWKPAESGGYTICIIYDDNDQIVVARSALCSVKDAFCYRVGRAIARGRALKALEETREGVVEWNG